MKISRTVFITWILSSLLAGCAVYPTTRTYFEPNSNDGVPTASMSCGYNKASKDSLARKIGDLEIRVIPTYEEGKPLVVYVRFSYWGGSFVVDRNRIELYTSSYPNPISTSNVIEKLQKPTTYNPYYADQGHLTFPVPSEKLSDIKIFFPRGSVMRNGQELDVASFRFQKVTKSDIYYASINC